MVNYVHKIVKLRWSQWPWEFFEGNMGGNNWSQHGNTNSTHLFDISNRKLIKIDPQLIYLIYLIGN